MTRTMAIQSLNGIDVSKLFETIEALRAKPGLADFRFRLRNRWIAGGHNRSTIQNSYGAGAEQEPRAEPFVLDADEPPVLLGQDQAANPVEHLLHALTSCVTTSIVYHAAAKGVRIQAIESRVEGSLDLRGFLGLDDQVPRGYRSIRMRFRIQADAAPEKLEEVLRLGPTFSPVFDTVTRGVPVEVTLDR
jgi:uncharacterized OsmC-like protein